MDDASGYHRQHVANAVWNDGKLQLPDREYIQHIDDLLCLEGDAEDSWVHRFVSLFLSYFAPYLHVSHNFLAQTPFALLTMKEYLPHTRSGTQVAEQHVEHRTLREAPI